MSNTKQYDLIIRNATIIDGTGEPGYAADLAVQSDSIAAIGDLTQSAGREEIDATDLILAPGFIDAHTHDDRALLANPDMLPKLSQGVTTVIGGNCGVSISPLSNRKPVPPLNLLGDQSEWIYPDFDAYAEAADRNPSCINSAMLTGHSTLRVATMDELDRAATGTEIDQMKKTLDQSLSQGSIGLSTGLAYPPAAKAPAQEIVELARVVHDHSGIYTTHMRDEEDHVLDSVEETIALGDSADVPVVISHHKACGRNNWGRSTETLKKIAAAREHQTIDLDVYPYTASSTVLLADFVRRAERVMITWSEPHPEHTARDLNDIAEQWGCSVDQAIDRLNPAGAIYFQMSDEDLERILQFSGAMIGSDGLPHDRHPHPRLWGTFPRVLGHYARDKKLMPLEQAVHRMTGKPASVFGLDKRGVLASNHQADLVLFSRDRIIDKATFEKPDQLSVGIEWVMVNGQTVYDKGRITDARPGRLLRSR